MGMTRDCVAHVTGAFAPAVEALERRQLLSTTTFFTQTNLVSDGFVPAAHKDPNLVNPWGVSFAPGGPFWVSDNGTSKSTLYDAAGNVKSLVVNIPGAGKQASAPTGQVYNGGGGFVVHKGKASGSSLFIFVGEDGGISGWSPSVDFKNAVLAVDGSKSGAVFKGAAMAAIKGKEFLYAADFHNGKIAVFDGNFKAVNLGAAAFQDAKVPKGFAPFNVQAVGNNLFVTYAKQDKNRHDDVAGAGNGYVDEFDTSGHLLLRFQHGSFLSSPWGVTQAPGSFGKFGGDLLVGNFGSGQIAAFKKNGAFDALLAAKSGKPIAIDGLWALTFGGSGADADSKDKNGLFFTAGPAHESHGLFGELHIQTVQTPPPYYG